jgi:hypothetical protein
MLNRPENGRYWLVAAASVMLAACQQVDQALPFDLAAGTGATVTLGPNGGTVSVPPSFSINFPAGSLPMSTTVDVAPRISGPFPGDAGASVPGSTFDVGPVGTMLSTPARVELAVDPALLDAGDEVRISIAVVRQGGSVATFDADYDLTNGIVSADIDELGPLQLSSPSMRSPLEPTPLRHLAAVPFHSRRPLLSQVGHSSRAMAASSSQRRAPHPSASVSLQD